MNQIPPEAYSTILEYRCLFSKSVFKNFVTLLMGCLLKTGDRTVCGCLFALGMTDETRFHKYHRVLSRACWSPLKGSQILLKQILARFHSLPAKPLVFSIDETLERRWGGKINKRGIYRDAVRSSKGHLVKCSGLRWICMSLISPVSWTGRLWALPFMTVLAPSERYYDNSGSQHKKVLDWAAKMCKQVRRWLPDRKVVVVADGAYSAIEFLADVGRFVAMITPLRSDAALYSTEIEEIPAKPGRKARIGVRLPTLKNTASDERTLFKDAIIALWYGQIDKEVLLASGIAFWYHTGKSPIKGRWVIVKDKNNPDHIRTFWSTDTELTEEEIIQYYCLRWNTEVTFEEARNHLGVETQRQWSDKAIERTTPLLFGAFSLVAIWADILQSNDLFTKHTTAWYQKKMPTFSDAIANVRLRIWMYSISHTSTSKGDVWLIPHNQWKAVINYCARTA